VRRQRDGPGPARYGNLAPGQRLEVVTGVAEHLFGIRAWSRRVGGEVVEERRRVDAPGSSSAVRRPQRPEPWRPAVRCAPGGLPDRHRQRRHQVEADSGTTGCAWSGTSRGGSRTATRRRRHRPVPPLSRRPALLADMGHTAQRFSVEWARVEPGPGHFDLSALRHYAGVVAACRELGMEPVVTLHHFTCRSGWRTAGASSTRSSAPLCPLCGRLRRGVRRGGPLVGDAQRAERPHGPRLRRRQWPPHRGRRLSPCGPRPGCSGCTPRGDRPTPERCRPRPAGDGLDRPPRTALPASSRLHRRRLVAWAPDLSSIAGSSGAALAAGCSRPPAAARWCPGSAAPWTTWVSTTTRTSGCASTGVPPRGSS